MIQVKAIEKADQMLQLIGYPDWLMDVAEVKTDRSNITSPRPQSS